MNTTGFYDGSYECERQPGHDNSIGDTITFYDTDSKKWKTGVITQYTRSSILMLPDGYEVVDKKGDVYYPDVSELYYPPHPIGTYVRMQPKSVAEYESGVLNPVGVVVAHSKRPCYSATITVKYPKGVRKKEKGESYCYDKVECI